MLAAIPSALNNSGYSEDPRSAEKAAPSVTADDRAYVGLKQIRAHARDISHVITHVVRDDGGVSRVVLGDAGFHLAPPDPRPPGSTVIPADTRNRCDSWPKLNPSTIVSGKDIDDAAAHEPQPHDTCP